MRRLCLLLMLCGCARSSQPAFYTLSARDGAPLSEVKGVVEVRTPKVAGYLDRHELVLRVSAQRLELAGDAQWAEPLDVMLARVLARDLQQRLPAAQVTVESGHARAEASVRVDLDMRRFEGDGDRLVLDALVALRPPQGAPRLQTVTLEREATRGEASMVAGMSELLAELATRIAAALAQM
jgi:uncharacterized lipoprotein YmbA